VIHQSAALQADAHSQAVATTTLAALVPAWLAAGRGSQHLWSSLLAALPGLPSVRRIGLLEALLSALPQVCVRVRVCVCLCLCQAFAGCGIAWWVSLWCVCLPACVARECVHGSAGSRGMLLGDDTSDDESDAVSGVMPGCAAPLITIEAFV
jgi:hypothetical protein